MTLIIGILCKDCVLMACDSQVTAGNNKRTDGTKLRAIEFADMSALIAQAGSLTHTNRYIDLLGKLVKDRGPNTVVEVGELMNEAMDLFRRQLRASHFNCSSEKLDAILEKKATECNLMLGFYLDRSPHLLSISLAEPLYRECTSHYEADGTGALLGEYLLREHSTPGMKTNFASTIAVYVVGVVKEYDTFCSGKTTVGMALGPGGVGKSKRSRTRFLNEDTITEYADLILKAETKTRKQRNRIIYREFEKQDAAFMKEVVKMMNDAPPFSDEDYAKMMPNPDAPEASDEEES